MHTAADLLAAYLPGSYYFSSPRGVLLADGVHARVGGTAGARGRGAAAALAAATRDGVEEPVAVGAIGFWPDAEATLFLPSVVRRAAPLTGRKPAPAGLAPRWSITHRPAPRMYADSVRRALDIIHAGGLDKVVLARCLELTADAPVRVPQLLTRLVRNDPAAYAFALDVSAPGDAAPRTLLGASPELLVARRGDTVVANPLAGSVPRAADDADNQSRIRDLRRSPKDRAEHAHVAAQVAAVLRRHCVALDVPEPTVVGTPTMWHLSTRITGRLADPGHPDSSALALAEALHPTPAVCGVPEQPARTTIADLEPEDRGYYSGLVGWVDAHGDGEWVVTIRSAEVYGRTVRAFAGAGIVAGSDPAAELAETSAKFRTLLGALGVDGGLSEPGSESRAGAPETGTAGHGEVIA
ncbi:isochorismate synthase [Pilimelia terevasa]|uniref:isochorismate synthase n=1 Tax=Pilimelia terevasa TaxID=53372 RepID=UPI001E343C84|nr:isochorismate synthase [Pilimelia terevasa]